MLNFVLPTPSLQQLAGVKIVAHLWTQRDISTQIAQSFDGLPGYLLREEVKEWKAIEENVRSKVWALSIPELCKNQLLNFVKPLGMQIIAWCHYHNVERKNYKFLDILLGNQLCWTMHGTVDYMQTAQSMVKDERFDVERRYELACINCLEDEARALFRSMGEERRREYVDNNKVNINMKRMDHLFLLTSFTCTFTGDVRRLKSVYQLTHWRNASVNRILFEDALSKGGGAMCEYLFNKLNHWEKDRVLEDNCQELVISCTRSPTSSLLFYLSLMNEEQQRRMFQSCIRNVLVCLLRWPMQSLFVQVAECGWQFMNSRDCTGVLKAVTFRIGCDYKDYDYSQLFWECWVLSSAEYKAHFLDNISNLYSLLLTKREEFIKLILNQASSVQLKAYFNIISKTLLDESGTSDTALIECKETAALNSSKDPDNREKRLRSEHVSRLVDITGMTRMKKRIKSRETNALVESQLTTARNFQD